MKTALIIGASGGIGSAISDELVRRGVQVRRLSRRDDGLDVTDPASVERHIGQIAHQFDLVLVAVGILGDPEKSLSAIKAAEMADVIAVNAIGPALILRHLPDLLPRREPGVCAVLSARVGSIGDNQIGGWHSYRASKSALNQIVKGAAIEMARTHKQSTVVALHPGTVATDFTARYAGRHKTVPAAQAAKNLLGVIDALAPADTGRFLDYAGREIDW